MTISGQVPGLPATGTVSAQLAAPGTISGQLIDLTARDPRTGRFIAGGSLPSGPAKADGDLAGRSKASITAHDTASADARARLAADRAEREARGEGSPDGDGTIAAALRDPAGEAPDDERGAALQKHVSDLEDQVKALSGKLEKLSAGKEHAEDEERERQRAEVVIEIGAALVGVAFSVFTSGASLAAAIPLVKDLFREKAPDMMSALLKYNIVDKGMGRAWAAYPVAKSAALRAAAAPVVKSVSRQAASAVRAAASRSAALLPSRGAQPVGLAAGPAVGAGTADAAASAVRMLVESLVGAGTDPQAAQEFAVACLGTYAARNWDFLASSGIDPQEVTSALPGAGTIAAQLAAPLPGG